MRQLIATIFIILLHALCIGAQTPQVDMKAGYQIATFETPHGRVRIYLPDDIRPGDTISAALLATADAGASFEGYIVDVAGTRVKASAWFLKFNVPAGAATLSVSLTDPAGATANAAVRVITSKGSAPSEFDLPRIGQPTRMLEIPGPFDGDFGTSRATIGEKTIPFIAESPRKLIILAPRDPIGPTTLTVIEKGKTISGEFRNVGVDLSAPNLQLKKGETTMLTVLVSGLQGIRRDVPLDLVTTGSVNTEGGNSQYLRITPNQVGTDGRVTMTRTLTAVENGTFNVTANVVVRTP